MEGKASPVLPVEELVWESPQESGPGGGCWAPQPFRGIPWSKLDSLPGFFLRYFLGPSDPWPHARLTAKSAATCSYWPKAPLKRCSKDAPFRCPLQPVGA